MKRLNFLSSLAGAALAVSLSACGGPQENPADAAEAGNGGQCAIEAIMTRTSIRAYTPDSVSAADVQTILKAAMAAPTAVNKQPWKFVVVNDKTILKSLADTIGSMRMAADAQVAIAVCGDLDLALEGDGRDFWIQDCSAATENLLVAANALGLGAVWCGVYPIEEKVAIVRDVLRLPDNLVPLCVVPIGHPAAPQEPKDKWKPENIRYNTWEPAN